MGLNLKRDMRRNVPINFTREEMSYYMKHFRQIDVENKGFLTLSDLKRHLQVSNLINFLSNRFTSMKIILLNISFQRLNISGLVSLFGLM
jgi:Ca2+-binding EF-hand superfamily protein